MDSMSKSVDFDEINFDKIISLDRITIKIVPEKRGLILKHVEYDVQSQRHKSSVKRRFNDFILVHQLLLSRFPYRLIPQLPPKKFVGNGDFHFIEDRRKRLERFANLISRHPVISSDHLWRFFLTERDDEFQSRIKSTFVPTVAEFYSQDYSESKLKAMDMSKYPLVKEQLSLLQQSLSQLNRVAVNMVNTSQQRVIQMLDFGKGIDALVSRDESMVFRGFSQHIHSENLLLKFITISEEIRNESLLQESEIVELLDSHMSLLIAYKELCVRYESELRKHSKQTNSGAKTFQPTSETMEELERKSQFALHCLLSEANLIKAYSSTIPLIIHNMSKIKSGFYSQLSKLFGALIDM